MELQFVIYIVFVSSCSVQGFIFSKECGTDTCTSSESCIDFSSGEQCISRDKLDECGLLSVCLLPQTCCNTFFCCREGYMCADDSSSIADCIPGVRSTTHRPSHTTKPTLYPTKTWPTRRWSTSRTTRRPNNDRSNSYSSTSSSRRVTWYYFFIPIVAVILIGVAIAIVCNARRSRGQQGEVVQASGNQAVYSPQQGYNVGGQVTMAQNNPTYGAGNVMSNSPPMQYATPYTTLNHPGLNQLENQHMYDTIPPPAYSDVVAPQNQGTAAPVPAHGGPNTLHLQQYVSYNNASQRTNIAANTKNN